MDWLESLDLSAEDLKGRRTFLLDRADWHFEHIGQSDARSRLLAATLWRDASAISIILGDFHNAQELLVKSASAYLSETVLYGLMVATIGGDPRPWRTYAQSLKQLRGYLDEGHAEAYAIPQDTPAPDVPQSDLVAVLQAFTAAPRTMWRTSRGDDISDRFLFNQVIRAVDGQLGVQDDVAPNSIYMRCLLELASNEIDESKPTISTRFLTALATAREAELVAARKDVFNWSLVPNPAEVVDFDLIVLTMAMIEQGIDGKIVDVAFGSPDGPVALPIQAARALHSLSYQNGQ